MKNAKSVTPFVDLRIGKFPRVVVISAALLIILSLPRYNGISIEDCLFAVRSFCEGLASQFEVISSNRENPNRSIVLLTAATIIGITDFIIFTLIIPETHVIEKYLKSGVARNYARLVFYCLFYYLLVVGTLHIAFVVPDWDNPTGRFGKIIATAIKPDVGLGLVFLLLLTYAAYFFAMTIRMFIAHIRSSLVK